MERTEYYDESSLYAGAAIATVVITLYGVYRAAREVFGAPLWVAIMLDVAIFVGVFTTWVKRTNAAYREMERKALEAAKNTAGKPADKKRD